MNFDYKKMPYDRVVAAELLRLANLKPTARFESLQHIADRKVTIKLHRFACSDLYLPDQQIHHKVVVYIPAVIITLPGWFVCRDLSCVTSWGASLCWPTNRERPPSSRRDLRKDALDQIQQSLDMSGMIEASHVQEFTATLGMKVEADSASNIACKWNEVG